jgi:hypothetical protein
MGTDSDKRVLAVIVVALLVVSGLPTVTTAQDGSETDAEISISPQQPAPFEPVKFDASETTVPADSSARFVWSYETTEGTQTAYGQSFVHTFQGVGAYDVRLRVEDSSGGVDTTQRTVQPRAEDPTADFKAYPSSPGLNERITFDPSPSQTPDLEIVEYQWFVNGEPQTADRRLEKTFTEPDLYTIGLKITDRAGQTDRISKTFPIGDKDAIYDNPAFDLSRTAPERDVGVNPNETILFATKIESEELPQATQVFSVDGSVVSRSDVRSNSVQSTYEFTQLGAHTVEMKVEGVAGQVEQVRWDVTTHPFNSEPTFSEQSSETTLDVDGNTAVLTFSVRNPGANTQQLETEILTKLPDGMSISGASDVSSGDAAIQAASSTVSPGQQTSLRLEVNVNDESLAGKRLIIPYQIRYYPQGNSRVIYTADSQEIEVSVDDTDTEPTAPATNQTETDSSEDSAPGFGIATIVFSLLVSTLVVSRWGDPF